ncbi:Os04g0561350 [Oryza sativa Japonica Group]|jgi:hypothetical protein|uniref:Os04g0561350 protein n=1 Tax=Oryza sativa subsp. japonica TaxID=39947 RepID=A0A0P0WDI2_ORYSJ|nr:Os04g0561350 [Oryza sativa Japonica Group]
MLNEFAIPHVHVNHFVTRMRVLSPSNLAADFSYALPPSAPIPMLRHEMLDSVLRRRAAYASATLVAPPPLLLLLLSLPPLFAASAAVAAAATGCIYSCRSCGDGVDMASSACRLRERGASAPCR